MTASQTVNCKRLYCLLMSDSCAVHASIFHQLFLAVLCLVIYLSVEKKKIKKRKDFAFGINLMRSQVLNRAAQVSVLIPA